LSPLSGCVTVRAMKNKSHISSWAIALCAVAVFSVTGTAYGIRLPDPSPGPIVKPISESPGKPLQPLPPIAPPVESGTFTGTFIAD
jgi:hypothetical protein